MFYPKLLLAWLCFGPTAFCIEMSFGDADENQSSNVREPLVWYLRWFDAFHSRADDWTDVPPDTQTLSTSKGGKNLVELEQSEETVEATAKSTHTTPDTPPLNLPFLKRLNTSSSITKPDEESNDWTEFENNILILESSPSNDASANKSDNSGELADDYDDYGLDIEGLNNSSEDSSQSDSPFHFSFSDFNNWLEYDPNTTETKEFMANQTTNNLGKVSNHDSGNSSKTHLKTTKIGLKPRSPGKSVLNKLPEKLWLYVAPPIVLGGTVGNALVLCVLRRKQMLKKTAILYLIVLSVIDTVLLDIDLLNRWLKVAVDVDIRVLSDVSCKLYMFSIYVLHQLAPWLIILATVERTVAVFYPWCARDIFTKRCEAVAAGIITLVIIIFNVHFLVTQELFPVYHKATGEAEMTCGTSWQPHRWFVHTVWPWMDLTLFAVMPYAVIILCNGYIVRQFVLHRASRPVQAPEARMEEEPGPSRPVRAGLAEGRHEGRGWMGAGLVSGARDSTAWRPKMVSVTKMVIIINTCFLITNLPLCIVLLGENTWLTEASHTKVELLHIFWVSAHLLTNTFQACKFVLYWLVSKRIRQIFRRMFKNQSVDVEDLQANSMLETGL